MDLLQYSFFQNALIGSLLTAIACGIVGTYIVARRLVFISGGITHDGCRTGFYISGNIQQLSEERHISGPQELSDRK